MKESLFITRIVYFLYLILLGIFGIIIGFLLGLYKREDKINTFLLLLLLKIISNNGFDDVLLEYLHDLSLETNTAETFSKFSLKSIEQIDPRPLKITLKEPEQISLPFLIIEDPLVVIETEVFWKKPINYKLELFKFYQNVNEKVNPKRTQLFCFLILKYIDFTNKVLEGLFKTHFNYLITREEKCLKKFTFESEGLTVDYVTFNFEQLTESRKAYLVNYFYKLGFNSYNTDRKDKIILNTF